MCGIPVAFRSLCNPYVYTYFDGRKEPVYVRFPPYLR